ncbi:MAG TPA: molybdopterin-synthase adenylyltransferase MoeB [Gemmatimonadaceae bacterium]|nr:molybdopterin-synthase adenylyltransferase MoeB [Gemmatimonadaceae bacterium]
MANTPQYTTGDERSAPTRPPELTREELVRYNRQIILPQVGEEGQRKLKQSRVLLIGAGGLGSPVALYLAAAGVGTIGLVDFDNVDLSNLHRQTLHGSAGIGSPKIDSARDRLYDINPNVHVETYGTRLTSENALDIASGYDLIVDGTDNFATRYLVNDTAVLLGIPNVYGSVYRFEGQASVFAHKDGPCYRCLFREPPPPELVPSCAEAGVLGVIPGLIGTIQATETVKLLLGVGETLVGKLLMVDAMTMGFRTITIRKDPECPACGTREITELIDYDEFCGGGTNALERSGITEILPAQLAERIRSGEDLEIIDVREPYEWQLGHIPGARLVPLGKIAAEISRLDKKRETILYCKVGVRSMYAAEQLADAGVADVRNLAGGILRWIHDVDPSLPGY